MLKRFLKRHYPIVVIGRTFHHPEVDRVVADGRTGGCTAVQHLVAQGHRRIAFIGMSRLGEVTLNRFQGYLDALRGAGLAVDPDLTIGPGLPDHAAYVTQMDGYRAMRQLLQLPSRPTAVFTRNDTTAIGALFAARDAGLQVPRDMSIVGFDNVALTACTSPALTTVDQFVVEQGQAAVRLLLDRIEDKGPRPGQSISFDCRLVVRESTATAQE
jgi:LacI family transcriptional regulator